MSINSMADAALRRRMRATAALTGRTANADDAAQGSEQVAATLSAITAYIPTEVLTLYVAVRAALAPASETNPAPPDPTAYLPEWWAFGAFLVATPIVVWLVFAAKARVAQSPVSLAPSNWPWWELAAATTSYVAWAFALPNSPFRQFQNDGLYSPAIAAVVVLVTSTALGLVAPLVTKAPIPSDTPDPVQVP